MLAASSDVMPASTIRRLLSAGADPNAIGPKGETALGFAQLRGRTSVVDLLSRTSGTRGAATSAAAMAPSRAASTRAAVERSLPLLQRTGATFRSKAGCVSCHNNTLTAMSVSAARRAGIVVDEAAARAELQGIGGFLETWRERVLQGIGIPGDADTVAPILLGLAEEQYPAGHGDGCDGPLSAPATAGRWQLARHRTPASHRVERHHGHRDVSRRAPGVRAGGRSSPATIAPSRQRRNGWPRLDRRRPRTERLCFWACGGPVKALRGLHARLALSSPSSGKTAGGRNSRRSKATRMPRGRRSCRWPCQEPWRRAIPCIAAVWSFSSTRR